MISENDALSLEYKLKEGCALGHLDLADITNNPLAAGVLWVFGDSLQEQLVRFVRRECGALTEDLGDASLVSVNRI